MEAFTIAQSPDAFDLLAKIKNYFDRGGKKPLTVTVDAAIVRMLAGVVLVRLVSNAIQGVA